MHLFPARPRSIVAPLPRPPAAAPEKTFSREEAQELVDAALAQLDGFAILVHLAGEGRQDARAALRRWRELLAQVQSL